MLNIKSVLGATYTTWDAASPCRVENSTVAVAGEWNGVYCTLAGKVSAIFPPSVLLHSAHAAIDRVLPALLPPVASGMVGNYLMGSVPALASQLRVLDVGYNFLTDVPAVTYTFCGGVFNCLLTPSKCASSSTTQRPAADCAICGTTNGVGPFCSPGNGVCSPNAAAAVATGTVNVAKPALPVSCMGATAVPLTASNGPFHTLSPLSLPPSHHTHCAPSAAAMLSVKSALGLTFTTWATTNPCQLIGAAATAGVWDTLLCNSNGNVVQM
ncbi:unnamed protein product [Closterium sp. Yama58-4]|nr:unnamed protein product [Closterium sp. Yama58-4]